MALRYILIAALSRIARAAMCGTLQGSDTYVPAYVHHSVWAARKEARSCLATWRADGRDALDDMHSIVIGVVPAGFDTDGRVQFRYTSQWWPAVGTRKENRRRVRQLVAASRETA